MREKIKFYQEIIISTPKKHPEFTGRKGVVMGISEHTDESGQTVYGYSASVEGCNTLYSFDDDEIEATGVTYKREDFY